MGTLRSAALAGAMAVALVGAPAVASAQPADADEAQARRARVEAELDARALTRPLDNPPAIGVAAEAAGAQRIDWAGVRALLAETRMRSATTSGAANRPTGFVGGLRSVSPEQFRTIRAAEVAPVRLPVLAPATPEILSSLQVFGQPDAYSATAEAGIGVAMRISGTRRTLIVSDPRSVARLRSARANRPVLSGLGAPYSIARSESSTDLSFSRFGAGYVISLMCDDPDGDPRCASDDFIVSLADSLVLLNESAGDGQ